MLRVPRGAGSLAPPQPGAGTAALQRGAALGRHGDPAVPVSAQEGAAAAQVHQNRCPVSGDGGRGAPGWCRGCGAQGVPTFRLLSFVKRLEHFVPGHYP